MNASLIHCCLYGNHYYTILFSVIYFAYIHFSLLPIHIKMENNGQIFEDYLNIQFLFFHSCRRWSLILMWSSVFKMFPNAAGERSISFVKPFTESQIVLWVIGLIDSFKIFVSYLSLTCLYDRFIFLTLSVKKQLGCLCKN